MLVEADYHLAFAVADARHVNREAVESDAKLFASANVGRDLRTVDNVLARQAGDVQGRIRQCICDRRLRPAFLRQQTSTQQRSSPCHHRA